MDLLLGNGGASKSYCQFSTEKRTESQETGPHVDAVAEAALLFSTRCLDHLTWLGLAIYIYVQSYYEQLKVMHVICYQTKKLKAYLMKLSIIATGRC